MNVKPKTYCSVDGCNGETRGMGFCGKHYQRWQYHEDPEFKKKRMDYTKKRHSDIKALRAIDPVLDEKMRVETRVWMQERKRRAIEVLGGSCVCCGIDVPWVLTVDHVKPLAGKRRESQSIIFRKIIDGGERSEYQVMCSGCNSSKNHGSQCTLDHTITGRWAP